jgi:conjugal transfer pilus assembly protein TraK
MVKSCLSLCLGIAALVTVLPLRAADDPGIALPPVPRSLLAAAGSGEGFGVFRPVAAKAAKAGKRTATLELGPRIVHVSPGTTAIVEVAIDHLNRILTPFANPKVRTVSEATTQVDGNVVYVATASEAPVSLYITDGDDPQTALALTLAPRHIPPREVRLVLAPGSAEPVSVVSARSKDSAARTEPYVEQLAAAFRALAESRIPAGFGLRPAGRAERVSCTQAGLAVRTGQVLEGHALRLLVARVRNRGAASVEIDEHACRASAGEVAAVAAWPRRWLAPGEAAELYVAVRLPEPERARPDRPSLLGGRP